MIQPQNILELQQLALQNLSEDKELFKKELVKSLRWLRSYEIYQLHRWLKDNYYETHNEIISDVFYFIHS